MEIADPEAALRLAEEELAPARAALEAARSDEHRTGTRLDATRVELGRTAEVQPRAQRKGDGASLDPRPALQSGPGQTDERPRGRQAELLGLVGVLEQDLIAAQERNVAAQQVLAGRTEVAEAARQSLEDARNHLWTAVRDDAVMRQARALATSLDGRAVDPTQFALAEIPPQVPRPLPPRGRHVPRLVMDGPGWRRSERKLARPFHAARRSQRVGPSERDGADAAPRTYLEGARC